MAESVKTPTSIATKWALINFAIGIVLTYTFEFLDIAQESPVRYVTTLPLIIFVFLAQKEYKEALGNYITFGQGFSVGFRYSVFAGLLSALFIYVYTKFLNPGSYEDAMVKAEDDMVNKGMSPEQIEVAMGFARNWGRVMGAFFGAIFTTIVGTVISLIGAAIFKKERSPFDNDNVVVVENDPVV